MIRQYRLVTPLHPMNENLSVAINIFASSFCITGVKKLVITSYNCFKVMVSVMFNVVLEKRGMLNTK